VSRVDPAVLILSIAVVAWRCFEVWKGAHQASRRWHIRTAVWWSLLLLAIDLILLVVAVLVAVLTWDATRAQVLTAPDTRTVAPLAAAAVAAAVRHVPWRVDGRRTSLQQYVLAQIEQACYDKADEWIYRVVYPAVTGAQVKPFLNAIRGYLESQPGAQGSLDASYVGKFVAPGRSPSREDLRAACHRMLARSGRRRLFELVERGMTTVEPRHRAPAVHSTDVDLG